MTTTTSGVQTIAFEPPNGGELPFSHGIMFLGNGDSAQRNDPQSIRWEEAKEKMRAYCLSVGARDSDKFLNRVDDISLTNILEEQTNYCRLSASFNNADEAKQAAKQCAWIWMETFPEHRFYTIYTKHQIRVKNLTGTSIEKIVQKLNEECLQYAPFSFQAEPTKDGRNRLVFTFEGSNLNVRSRASNIQDWLHFGMAGNHNALLTEAAGGGSVLISSLEMEREEILRKQTPDIYTPKKAKV